jgi:murein DD-endopeptidase MepM/ murein hydrolase activator NlpD
MDASGHLVAYLKDFPDFIGKVVDFNAGKDRVYHFDLTANNPYLDEATFSDTETFSGWINSRLLENGCKYGIGGYMEHRNIYARSAHFDNDGKEPRRLHLGVDIWARAGTPVYAPLAGKVHSFNDNNNFGDYGPTIILAHNLDGLILYSLYGHLSRKSLEGLSIGMPVKVNSEIGAFGNMEENGHWPPHLHFQLMFDMEGNNGDYPGVCRFSEKEKYLHNVPDPQLILQFPKAVNQ